MHIAVDLSLSMIVYPCTEPPGPVLLTHKHDIEFSMTNNHAQSQMYISIARICRVHLYALLLIYIYDDLLGAQGM